MMHLCTICIRSCSHERQHAILYLYTICIVAGERCRICGMHGTSYGDWMPLTFLGSSLIILPETMWVCTSCSTRCDGMTGIEGMGLSWRPPIRRAIGAARQAAAAVRPLFGQVAQVELLVWVRLLPLLAFSLLLLPLPLTLPRIGNLLLATPVALLEGVSRSRQLPPPTPHLFTAHMPYSRDLSPAC